MATIGRMATAGVRERIIEAATSLLSSGGADAVSTRAVSAAAGVQAPTIYRLFGDKQGLLDAVASHGMAVYLRAKVARERVDDPVEDLRRGWDLHVGFGLEQPAVYALIYGTPRKGEPSPAQREATAMLATMVRRVALAGRLRVSEERAIQLIQSTGRGTTLTLIGLPEDQRDPALATLARESVLAATTTDAPAESAEEGSTVRAAVTLRSALDELDALTKAERALLGEWLDRVVADR